MRFPRKPRPAWADHVPQSSRGPVARRSAVAVLTAGALLGGTAFTLSPLPAQLGLVAESCNQGKAVRQLAAARETRTQTRALLTDPRILILDDSTSAIDSATEDQIQRAINRVLEGRTTLLITHRLSQIRRADKILVLHGGEIVDQGKHEELMGRCDLYRRIFARYE